MVYQVEHLCSIGSSHLCLFATCLYVSHIVHVCSQCAWQALGWSALSAFEVGVRQSHIGKIQVKLDTFAALQQCMQGMSCSL